VPLKLNVPRTKANALWQFALSRDLFYVIDNIMDVVDGSYHTVIFAFALFADFQAAHTFLQRLE